MKDADERIPDRYPAMVFDGGCRLRPAWLPLRPPGPRELLVAVRACGVCWSNLHIVDGELRPGALLFAPVGAPVPKALSDHGPGGTVVCGGIHLSDIPSLPYTLLREERSIRSVANLRRADAVDFMAIAERLPLRCETETFALADADQALDRLRDGRITGAAVPDCSQVP